MKRAQHPSPVPSPTKLQGSAFEAIVVSGDNDSDKNGWTKVEKRKLKKAKKVEASQEPRFMYSISDMVKRHRAVAIEDVRDLALHIVADAPPPNWLRVDYAERIPKVVALLIPGLTHELLSLPPLPTSATANPNVPISIPLPSASPSGLMTTLPFISSTFSHACPTRAPGDQMRMHSVLSSFCSGPISSTEKKRRAEQKVHSERLFGKDPAQYMVTLEQMIDNDYPVPSYMADVFQKPDGWVETHQPAKTKDEGNDLAQKIYAIDCEMCLTDDGKELARVCMIDYHTGEVVLDRFVKPGKPVTDYLTRWSGITESSLAPITTTLAEVQIEILRILHPPLNPFSTNDSASQQTPILVGHSVESDLKALKLCHPYCIDTALLYHHPRGRPLKPGLAWLTNKWCGREIQTRGDGGHDPEEDARACVELLQRKVENGSSFGEFRVDFESIFERMSRSTRRAGGFAGSIKSAVVDLGNPTAMHGNKATTSIGCKDDEEILNKVLDVLPSHHFIFARFTALANILKWTTPKDVGPREYAAPPPSAEELSAVLTKLDAQLKALHAALPPRTALILFTGHSDPRPMAALNARKNAFESAIRSGRPSSELGPEERWTAADVRSLEEAVERAKRGLLFLGVKT